MSNIAVVGAGFSGSTVARLMAEAGHQVTVYEARHHVAGNAYDYEYKGGIRVHEYGPHLFHTKNKRVVDFLSRFTGWIPYEHRVKALLPDGTHVVFPPNRQTKLQLEERGLDPIETFYRPYTEKMWGRPLEEVAPQILNRVPGRDDDEDRYFPTDPYQFLPARGYTRLVENMLDHPNITVRLRCKISGAHLAADHVFSTAPIDEWYGFAHGRLDYRSIKFETVEVPLPSALPAATVNFTHRGPCTRVTEWKKLPGRGDSPYSTVLTFETPCDYRDNYDRRFYPISDPENKARLESYKSIRDPRITHLGRCGSYAYMDLDQAVNQAMQITEKFLRKE